MNALELLATLLCAVAYPGAGLAQAATPGQGSSAAVYAWPLLLIALLVGLRSIGVAFARRHGHAASERPDRRSPWIPSGGRSPAGSARR